MTEKHKETVNEYLEKAKKYKYILAVIAVGILLLSVNVSPNQTENETANSSDEQDQNNQVVENLEQKLTELLSSIDGVGEIKVMITLESSKEYIYASEQKTTHDQSDETSYKQDSETNIIIVDNQEGKSAIPIKVNEPSIKGVAIVCEGANDIMVKSSVIEATKSVLGIGSNRISVSLMN